MLNMFTRTDSTRAHVFLTAPGDESYEPDYMPRWDQVGNRMSSRAQDLVRAAEVPPAPAPTPELMQRLFVLYWGGESSADPMPDTALSSGHTPDERA